MITSATVKYSYKLQFQSTFLDTERTDHNVFKIYNPNENLNTPLAGMMWGTLEFAEKDRIALVCRVSKVNRIKDYCQTLCLIHALSWLHNHYSSQSEIKLHRENEMVHANVNTDSLCISINANIFHITLLITCCSKEKYLMHIHRPTWTCHLLHYHNIKSYECTFHIDVRKRLSLIR